MEEKEIKNVNFKTDELWKKKLHIVSKVIDSDKSKFIRTAVDEKIEKLAKTNPKVAKALEEVAA